MCPVETLAPGPEKKKTSFFFPILKAPFIQITRVGREPCSCDRFGNDVT